MIHDSRAAGPTQWRVQHIESVGPHFQFPKMEFDYYTSVRCGRIHHFQFPQMMCKSLVLKPPSPTPFGHTTGSILNCKCHFTVLQTSCFRLYTCSILVWGAVSPLDIPNCITIFSTLKEKLTALSSPQYHLHGSLINFLGVRYWSFLKKRI